MHKHVRATAVASVHVQHRVKYFLLIGDQCPDEFGSINFNSYSKLVARQVILTPTTSVANSHFFPEQVVVWNREFGGASAKPQAHS